MITHRKIAWASILTVAALLVWWEVRADEQPARPLPDWVRSLITKHFPDSEFVRGHREGDEEDQRYEVKLKKDGRDVSADVTADAGVVAIDEELRHDQVPEKVMKSLRRAFPKAEIKHAEKNTDIRVTYQLEVTSDGRKREVTLSPRGKILEIEKRD
ncbi:MAG TPA: hypothetical protein VNT99_20115 [Methylomirabilota bacterium]|nr:hypothetical protein [Methylomirabilota bacterium]